MKSRLDWVAGKRWKCFCGVLNLTSKSIWGWRFGRCYTVNREGRGFHPGWSLSLGWIFVTVYNWKRTQERMK